jgi:hypothetical protein
VLSLKSVAEIHRVMYDSWDCGGCLWCILQMGLWNSSQVQEHCTTWTCLLMRPSELVTDGMTDHKDNEEEEDKESKDFEQVGNLELEDN